MTEEYLSVTIKNLDHHLSNLDINSPDFKSLAMPIIELRNIYLEKHCPKNSTKDWALRVFQKERILNKLGLVEIYKSI